LLVALNPTFAANEKSILFSLVMQYSWPGLYADLAGIALSMEQSRLSAKL
jgi:hypothetical protein